MKIKSVAMRNLTILILSLLPFIVGISISILTSSEMASFGVSINISGSERMRTMLIANYAQQYHTAKHESPEKLSGIKNILVDELTLYKKYMNALEFGDETLNMNANKYSEILKSIHDLKPLYNNYVTSTEHIILDSDNHEALEFIKDNSIPLKNAIHKIVELYQFTYDKKMKNKNILDYAMIIIAIFVTFTGILLTRLIKKQEYLANNDYLTGLNNRNRLYDFISDKKTKDFNVYFMDLNKFKIINDTYGHAIGDEILIMVSKRLIKAFDIKDVYRFGGDEFIVLQSVLEDENPQMIDNKILEIKKMFSEPLVDSFNRNHFVGISIGVASSKVGITNWDTLINFTDELMYDSKTFTGHVVVCDEAVDANTKLELASEIEDAFLNGDIQPHFQSIYNIGTEKEEIFIAIARWHHNDEIIRASDFIPMIHRKGLLYKLDKYIINCVDEIYSNFDIGHPLKDKLYMVNISEGTLLNAKSNGFLDVLEQVKMPNKNMGFKILENVLLDENIIGILDIIHQMGFILSVDHFTIDVSLKASAKFNNIQIVHLGKLTVDALMADEYSRKTLKEFINMLISIDKKVIIEDIKDHREIPSLKSVFSDFGDSLFYKPLFDLKTADTLITYYDEN